MFSTAFTLFDISFLSSTNHHLLCEQFFMLCHQTQMRFCESIHLLMYLSQTLTFITRTDQFILVELIDMVHMHTSTHMPPMIAFTTFVSNTFCSQLKINRQCIPYNIQNTLHRKMFLDMKRKNISLIDILIFW